MKCPFCNKIDSAVLESRAVDEFTTLRRRRQCSACKKRFTTYEKVKNHVLYVVKKDGKREPWDREKVKKGVLIAIQKRPVSLELVDELVSAVEREMLKKEKEEISSILIGKSILRNLKTIDKVAWLRFASVYLEFEDLNDFEKAISKLLK